MTCTAPADIRGFAALAPWWRTEVPTQIVLSEDGIGTLFSLIESRGHRPFFVVDSALENQPAFRRVFEQKEKYLFCASKSEPHTEDVDFLVEKIHASAENVTLLVGIGGGATMDLAKATGICLANPLPFVFHHHPQRASDD